MRRMLFLLPFMLVATGTLGAADGTALRNAGALRTSDAGTAPRAGDPSTGRAAPIASAAVSSRSAATSSAASSRTAALPRPVSSRAAATPTTQRGMVRTTATPATTSRATTPTATARAAAIPTNLMADTRIGAAYDQCKTAYFTCMDQFCAVKNSNYQRCSCSNRIYDLMDEQTIMTEASHELTKFTENLDTVGMTSAQATAMKTASEGENALTGDGSAAKALLQAIMNSIKGEDTTVGGKYSGLNTLSFNIDAAFIGGFGDVGQAIAGYNGQNLYSVIYAQCRQAVKQDCTDIALQRAVTAYLMAVEQDCNTVEKINNDTRKKLTAAVREGSAMLDLARIENRQKHNSSDMTTCLREVESAVLSEEVCGAGYHKCLDNGKFIDITTGTPISGVINFYELEHILTFKDGISVADQKLSKIPANKPFVDNFVSRVKKFAEPALDKCTEDATTVWADYLDKAMLDIYYGQRVKVQEIRDGCMGFVSACYMNGEQSLTAAMSSLVNTATTVTPDMIILTDALCENYVKSCDNMFTENGVGIIAQYLKETRATTDTTVACRAVLQSCFDDFGGTDYVNFYNRHSGLFKQGQALDWFVYGKSRCGTQLQEIDACRCGPGGVADCDPTFGKNLFGGFEICGTNYCGPDGTILGHHSAGVATEVYNKVLDILTNQCKNMYGNFIENQYMNTIYHYTTGCETTTPEGNICPYRYEDNVDVKSWGLCSCVNNFNDNNVSYTSCGGTLVRCILNDKSDPTNPPCPTP